MGTEDADVETSSDAYARRFSGAVGAWFLEVQSRSAMGLLARWPAARVVDVGGGHGQLTGTLVDAGHDLTVFGSSEACRPRIEAWVGAGQARFAAGDLLKAPFPDRAFDVALCFRLLPHVARWRTLIDELCRLAGRAVILDYPSARSINAMAGPLFRLKKGVEGDTRPFAVFRDAEVEHAFRERGFEPSGAVRQFFFPMALHRALRAAALARALEAGARAVGLTGTLGSPVVARFERRG